MQYVENISGIVYVAENLVTGEKYVGVTTRPLARRIAEHISHGSSGRGHSPLQRAMKQFGADTFRFYEVDRASTRAELHEKERHHIASLDAAYNATVGGGGMAGAVYSEEARAKISRSSIGRRTRLGKKESPSVVEAKRIRARNNIHIFEQYRAMGPAAASRAVICVDDGSLHESASAAARHYGVSRSALIELCLGRNGRKTVGGLAFKYAEVA